MPESRRLHTDAEWFFCPRGNVTMWLSLSAAYDACRQAAARGFVVMRVEGFIQREEGFEARSDCIFDGLSPPCSAKAAIENNQALASKIGAEEGSHDAFLLTVAPLSGFRYE